MCLTAFLPFLQMLALTQALMDAVQVVFAFRVRDDRVATDALQKRGRGLCQAFRTYGSCPPGET